MKTLMEMEVHTAEHRLVYRDMEDAFAAVSLFLPDDIFDAETKAWLATLSQTTQLVDNDAKAKTQPYWRSVLSNSSWPLKFWNGQWEEIGDAAYRNPEYPVWHLKEEPRVWDEVARPTIAHLFKAGIIGPGYCPYPSGQAMAVPAHPGDPRRDLFISYCNIRGDWPTMSSTMRDPHAIDLLAMARKHTAKHPNASFALLRIWSAPHFWPLMLGLEKRDWMSFSDVVGRSWTWSFVPKDMPFSEWSMQHTLDLRMERLKKSHLGRSFETKRDMILVMSESKEQLSSVLTPVVFTVQSNPWRFEVDFWKSFIGVDLAFLKKLDKGWVE